MAALTSEERNALHRLLITFKRFWEVPRMCANERRRAATEVVDAIDAITSESE